MSCGAIVLAHATTVLCHGPSCDYLTQACEFVPSFSVLADRLSGCGGLSPEQDTALRHLLIEKGVSEEQVATRIQSAISKIGPGAIAQALQSRNPWQGLKSACGKPGSNFRWVSQEELQLHVEAKAQHKFGLQVPKTKAKKRRPHRQSCRLIHKSSSASGGPLGQLHRTKVNALASGVCFCSSQQAAPYLSDGKNLSVDALALLITAPIPQESWGTSKLDNLRFPAAYGPT